jgi:glutathione-regulated potassium-efflux system ancillary protein KefC
MTDSVLAQAFVYLFAAVVFVPIAKRVGLGAVLGYLLAGVVIGPWALGLVGTEGHHVMHFAEFGVVMMLFLVGLELRPATLWQLRKPIVGLGGAQVVGTAVVVGVAAYLLGVAPKPAAAIGLIAAMSSTAIVLSTMAERGMLKTSGGQSTFSVLLFQDISVIPILAVFPLLAVGPVATAVDQSGRPAWQSGLLLLGAVTAVVGAGRFVVRPLFQFLAAVKLRESFTAAALMLVVGIALMMQEVGLSPALGTFLAGVVLADSEYRHELESDIDPFKGLLLGLFFISVGAQIDFGLIAADPLVITGIVVGVMAAKLLVLRLLGQMFGLNRSARWMLAFALAQIGEFAFVLLSFGQQHRIFGDDIAKPMIAAVAISMALTPLLFILLERVILPRMAERGPVRPHDEIAHAETPVVMAGYGRFGQVVGRILRANRIPVTILDLDPEIVDFLGRLGVKVYYGDASRVELLHSAGCAQAKVFVLGVDDSAEALKIAHEVKKHFPHLTILARAKDRVHYYQLRELGIEKVFRETFSSAYETGIETLKQLGYRAFTAHRLAKKWRDHEELVLEEQLHIRRTDGDDASVMRAQRGIEEAERLMRDVDPSVFDERDAAWDNESLRADRDPVSSTVDVVPDEAS